MPITLLKLSVNTAQFAMMTVTAVFDTYAAPTCGTHEVIASTLASLYNEVPHHRGLTPKGTMVEVFSSEAGTFSVVITIPNGRSCLVTAGTNWQEIDAASHGADKDASGDVDREF